MSEHARFLIPNRRGDVSAFADRFEAFCSSHSVPAAVVQTFQLALDEILTNVAEYAWPEGGDHRIEVRIEREPSRLCVEVVDDGIAFNPLAETAAPDLDASVDDRAIGGLGVHLVRELMDDVIYRRSQDRNHFIMRKQFSIGE